MSEQDENIVAALTEVHVGTNHEGPGWAKVRCVSCGNEAQVPTAKLPIQLVPIRDNDGVRLATCEICARPNRAERRRRR